MSWPPAAGGHPDLRHRRVRRVLRAQSPRSTSAAATSRTRSASPSRRSPMRIVDRHVQGDDGVDHGRLRPPPGRLAATRPIRRARSRSTSTSRSSAPTCGARSREQELTNHELQIEHVAGDRGVPARQVHQQRALRLDGRPALQVYFQTLPARLRPGQARRAGAPATSWATRRRRFIQFGYWDSLRKGLLAGERLLVRPQADGAAYLEHNRREYELTKHVSLALSSTRRR